MKSKPCWIKTRRVSISFLTLGSPRNTKLGTFRAGYKEVYNVLGSVKAWVAAGFPLTID